MLRLLTLILLNILHLVNAQKWNSAKEAGPGEIKYVVYIKSSDSSGGCTGAIISEDLVVSAASCFVGDTKTIGGHSIKVLAGITDIWNDQNPKRIEVDVDKVYIPYDFQQETSHANIAVIRLKEKLDLEKYNLTKLSLPDDEDFADKISVIAGFANDETKYVTAEDGSKRENGTVNKLRFSDMKIMSNKKCRRKMGDYFDVQDSHLCASIVRGIGKMNGPCAGGYGSPLVYDSRILVGVYIYGIYGCDNGGDPGQYTRVGSYKKFIQNAINDETDRIVYVSY